MIIPVTIGVVSKFVFFKSTIVKDTCEIVCPWFLAGSRSPFCNEMERMEFSAPA